MPNVTVPGVHGSTVTLNYDSAANAVLARQIAAAIRAGVQAGTVIPVEDNGLPPPALPAGTTGEFIDQGVGLIPPGFGLGEEHSRAFDHTHVTPPGLLGDFIDFLGDAFGGLPGPVIGFIGEHGFVTQLPSGYDDVVVTADHAVIFGSGDPNEAVLSSTGDLTFFATGGSGSVVAGGGDNRVIVPGGDSGNWLIATGNGDDMILANGSGNDTINPGGGDNFVLLGSGNDLVNSRGDDRIVMGSGSATIAAFDHARDVVYGGSGTLLFIAAEGPVAILGGSGSDTFMGGSGNALVQGGLAGHNMLLAGTGIATLIGGGDGDALYAGGAREQMLRAGGGAETLFGGGASGADTFFAGTGSDQITGGSGNDTLVAGSGAATITGGTGNDLFLFIHGAAGGTDLINNFTGADTIGLQGYGPHAVSNALASQTVADGSVTITLSDSTKVTFAGVTSLTAANFSTSFGKGDGEHHEYHGFDYLSVH